jgi:hypothetical protein
MAPSFHSVLDLSLKIILPFDAMYVAFAIDSILKTEYHLKICKI